MDPSPPPSVVDVELDTDAHGLTIEADDGTRWHYRLPDSPTELTTAIYTLLADATRQALDDRAALLDLDSNHPRAPYVTAQYAAAQARCCRLGAIVAYLAADVDVSDGHQ